MTDISIVMPVYNGEKYLEKSIISILMQTFDNWELILVNDCSIDASLDILKKYASLDRRIRIVNNDNNLKLPKSLNKGFREAKGKYFTWTSDDNIYEENAIAVMYEYLETHPECGLVYCDMWNIDESGNVIGETSSSQEELYYKNCVGACFMYLGEIVQTVGEYDPNMFLVEDYEYWIRISKKYRLDHIKQKHYYYRQHRESLTETKEIYVNKQLYKLRMKELDFLLSNINEAEKEILFSDIILQGVEKYEKLKPKFYSDGLPQNLKWLEHRHGMNMKKPIILFGAGTYGKRALRHLGEDRVFCFVDNNENIIGNEIQGKAIISFKKLKEIYKEYNVMISVDGRKLSEIANQLENNGILEYDIYLAQMICI